MRSAAAITMAAMLGSISYAATAKSSQPVVVCIEGYDRVAVTDAQARASNIFRTAGVRLDWRRDRSSCRDQQDQSIVVSFSTNTPKTFHPGALAYALPFEGVHIEVFYDRVAVAYPELVPYLLANVIVHEITHVLQGIEHHSKSGIMKAVWTSFDYTLMKGDLLRFTPLDKERIHDGLAARAAHRSSGPMVADVTP